MLACAGCLGRPANVTHWVRHDPAPAIDRPLCDACLRVPGVLYIVEGTSEEEAVAKAVALAGPVQAEVWRGGGRALVARADGLGGRAPWPGLP